VPRKQKTISGDPAQKVASVPGQRYGEGVEQQQMQQAMPAPKAAADVGAPPVSGSSPVVAAPVKQPPSPEALQAFLAANNPNLLSGTQLPDEPVTAGLTTGPGPGPEALSLGVNTTPIARTLRQISAATGNPKWARLADKANL